jgi:hypothetical protein
MREFLGADFMKWCQQNYDEAKAYLNRCGKPKDEYDISIIKIHKQTIENMNIFLRYKAS